MVKSLWLRVSDEAWSQTSTVSDDEPSCVTTLQDERSDPNAHSVPASFANRPVSLRVYADRPVIVVESQTVSEHPRMIIRGHDRQGKTIYDWRHYLAVVQPKAGGVAQRCTVCRAAGLFD